MAFEYIQCQYTVLLKRCPKKAVTFMTEAICFHCSGVGSVPVGLCAQAWRTKMENSGAFWGEGSHVSSDTRRSVEKQSQRHTGRGRHIPSLHATSAIIVWFGWDLSDSLTY